MDLTDSNNGGENMSISFQSTLFDTSWEAHCACAEAWLSADGLNNRNEIEDALKESTDAELAAECNEAWGMDQPPPPPSWINNGQENEHWFDLAELTMAFANVRENPAEAFGWDDE